MPGITDDERPFDYPGSSQGDTQPTELDELELAAYWAVNTYLLTAYTIDHQGTQADVVDARTERLMALMVDARAVIDSLLVSQFTIEGPHR